ncbi:MAG TPA: hypothetical protein VKA46_05895 [Gemmataceae bacterium]|nr:hypothetical protein [Gemmataceae bacterium]
MKRFALVASVVTALLSGVLLTRAARRTDAAVLASPSPAITAAEAAPLTGPAGWTYRHTQPNHWRACMLQH